MLLYLLLLLLYIEDLLSGAIAHELDLDFFGDIRRRHLHTIS